MAPPRLGAAKIHPGHSDHAIGTLSWRSGQQLSRDVLGISRSSTPLSALRGSVIVSDFTDQSARGVALGCRTLHPARPSVARTIAGVAARNAYYVTEAYQRLHHPEWPVPPAPLRARPPATAEAGARPAPR